MNKSVKKVACGTLASIMLLGTVPMAKAATPFTDVASGAWYAPYLDYAYNNKLMAGTSETTFAPNQIMTRGMLVTVLHGIAGNPTNNGNNPFSDVGDSWFTNAVIWCYEHGIVAGTSATTFSPDSLVTREQMVTILFNFAANSGLDTTSRAELSSYSDADRIESYAKDAFAWAVAKGVISGTSNTTLSPKAEATRAECAVVLQRYHELLNTKPDPKPNKPSRPDPTEPSRPDPTEPSRPDPTEPPQPDPTEPPQPEPSAPPAHKHEWIHKHYDEVGHMEHVYQCAKCSWYCTESIVESLGVDISDYWKERHQDTKGEDHSYEIKEEWHVDTPAYDEWSCSCGEVVYSKPEHKHEWTHKHYDGTGHMEETMYQCTKCNWYCTKSIVESLGVDISDYWKERHQDTKGEDHSYEIKGEWHVDTPAYDEWSCSCGEVVYSDPNA